MGEWIKTQKISHLWQTKQRCPSITIALILIQVKNKMSFKPKCPSSWRIPTTITKQLFPEYYGWYLLSSPCNSSSSSSSIHALVLPALIWHLMTTHPPTSHLVSEDVCVRRVWGGVSIMVSNSLVIVLPLVGIASWVLLMPGKASLISLISICTCQTFIAKTTHTKREEGERSKLPNGLNCKHQATSSWLQVPRAQ
jgi:hypothetical protein